MKAIIGLLGVYFLCMASAFSEELVGDAERGKELSHYCMGCHGEFGISTIDTNPNLAGQKATYIEYALHAYKSRERKGGLAPVMYVNAGPLSNQDIKDLALYFSQLPGSQPE